MHGTMNIKLILFVHPVLKTFYDPVSYYAFKQHFFQVFGENRYQNQYKTTVNPEAQNRAWVSQCAIFGGQVALGLVFL